MTIAPDTDRMLADARALAFPRYPGTGGDRRAIELVESKLRQTGLEIIRDRFSYDIRPAFRALRALMLGAALLVGGAGLMAASSLAGAGVALVIALAAGGTFLAWAPWLEKIYAADGPTQTSNLTARRSPERPRLTLLFVAHHDSKSQNLTLPYRAGLTLAALGGTLGLALVLVVAAVEGDRPPGTAAPVLGGIAALSLVVLSTIRNGNRSPGGVDNAGSVGLLLELARLLPDRIDPEVELLFVSPGAEEDHMVGSMRWLDVHARALEGRPVYALNFDGAGIPGRVVLLERYGLGRLFSPVLSKAARAAAARLGLAVRGVYLPPAMGVDAIPFVHRGIPCLTLASGSLGRASLAVHSAGDVAANLDGEALGEVAALAIEMSRQLAAGDSD